MIKNRRAVRKKAKSALQPRNAEATKAAILAAAKYCFSRESYDETGLRKIAKRTRVNVALVSRYFGSKHQLFLEAFADFNLDEFLLGDRATLGERFVRHALLKPFENDSNHTLLMLFRSASNEKAVPVIREALRSRFMEPLAA